jgi:hypothetical protein
LVESDLVVSELVVVTEEVVVTAASEAAAVSEEEVVEEEEEVVVEVVVVVVVVVVEVIVTQARPSRTMKTSWGRCLAGQSGQHHHARAVTTARLRRMMATWGVRVSIQRQAVCTGLTIIHRLQAGRARAVCTGLGQQGRARVRPVLTLMRPDPVIGGT